MLAADAPHAHYVVMMLDAYEKLEGFDSVRSLKQYIRVDNKGVAYIDKDGKEQFVPADLIVLSGGVGSCAGGDGQILWLRRTRTLYR